MSHHHQGIPTLNWNLDQIPTLLHVCGGLVMGLIRMMTLVLMIVSLALLTYDGNVLEKTCYTSGEDGGLFA